MLFFCCKVETKKRLNKRKSETVMIQRVEAVDMLSTRDAETGTLMGKPIVLPKSPDITSRVFVRRRDFEWDVRQSFTTEAAIQHQARLDFPRSDVEIDGRRCAAPPASISPTLLCLATQAIMGLPVALLHQAAPIVANANTPLSVRVDTSANLCIAHKDLLIPTDESMQRMHRIHVTVSIHDDEAQVVFSFVDDE